ncbi:MAG: hypothetical protein ABI811_19955 [Acidobacteriota bacterium]
MNLAHLHLLLNHFPTVGMVVGLALFLTALLWNSDHLKRVSLGVFLGIGLLAIPTYMTGNAAQEMLAKTPAASVPLIEAHQSWALLAFMIMEVTAFIAWLGLWQYRRKSHPSGWVLPAILILAGATFACMSVAANIGGEIMHPEIRDAAHPDGSVSWMIGALQGSMLKKAITDKTWIWALCETLHFIGLSILFGVVLLVDLRILGFVKGISYESVHKLMPWAVSAFALNLATGMVFFIAAADQYTTNPVFHWKVALILLAGLNAGYFTVLDDTWVLKAGEDAPGRAKFAAAAAMVLWVGVIFCGQMLPFIGNAF